MKRLARLVSVFTILAVQPAVRAAGQAPRFDDRLIELTAPVLEGLARGLKVEIALYQEFKAELAKYPTPEEYSTCQGQVSMSEDFQEILMANPIPDSASAEEGRRLMAKLQEALLALRKKMCPLDPGEWSMEQKAERLQQIVKRAAAAAGPVGAAPGNAWSTGATHGPWWSGDGAPDEGISEEAYKIAKERVALYCAYTRVHGVPLDDKLIRFPGKGKGIWWIFTPAEQQALEPRCRDLYPLIQQSNAYEPGGTASRP